jgi:hypothetical protein
MGTPNFRKALDGDGSHRAATMHEPRRTCKRENGEPHGTGNVKGAIGRPTCNTAGAMVRYSKW